MNDKKGLTITMIFKAQSLNYGEGVGNISELKKLTRGDGSIYTFASRQALRYDITRLGNKMFNWKLDNAVDKSQKVIQFKKELTIQESEEIDLFGYFKTCKKDNAQVRSAAVRLSHAISLESYKSDMEFLTDEGLADRINENPDPANIEQHLSYYTYTVTIDLEKIGIDGNIVLSNNERTRRIIELLEIIKVLNRDIRGREENLSPLFAIGGLYKLNSPFFLGRIILDGKNEMFSINLNIIKDTMRLKLGQESIEHDTKIGLIKDIFKNEQDIRDIFGEKVLDIQQFFESLENEVKEYYNQGM